MSYVFCTRQRPYLRATLFKLFFLTDVRNYCEERNLKLLVNVYIKMWQLSSVLLARPGHALGHHRIHKDLPKCCLWEKDSTGVRQGFDYSCGTLLELRWSQVVYIYPKHLEISDGMLMERLVLSPRTEIFTGKRDFLKGRPKFPNENSEWKMCVPFVSFH